MVIFGSFCEIGLRWVSQNPADDKSTLVQYWLGVVRHRAITWANVDPDLCRHMASLGRSELIPDIGKFLRDFVGFFLMTSHIHRNVVQHYSDVIMSAMASKITGASVIYLTVCSRVDQRKHQCSASLALVRGIHWWPVNSPHKGPVTRKRFPFDDAIVKSWSPDWYLCSHHHACCWLSTARF